MCKRVVAAAAVEERKGEIGINGSVDVSGRHEGLRAFEEGDRRAVVGTHMGASSGGGQARAGTGGQFLVERQAQLLPVPVSLLEVIAEDLIELRDVGRVATKPG